MIPVKYIGKREVYREGAYGSGLVFVQDQTINIEDEELARKMLRHADVYVRGDAKKAEITAAKVDDSKKDDDENEQQDVRDSIANMSKGALQEYAKTHFSATVDMRKTVGELRAHVTSLYDQFGTD